MVKWILEHRVALGIFIAFTSLLIAIVSLVTSLYRDLLLHPTIRYSVVELNNYPGASGGLSLAVKRGQGGAFVQLKNGIEVEISSVGWMTASDIEMKVTAESNSMIVQIHTNEESLVEQLPDIGRQGSREVFVHIARMVPREKVSFTLWYGVPDSAEQSAPPRVQIRHAVGLAQRISA